MLDRAGGGAGAGGDFGSNDMGSEFGSAGPSAPRKVAMADAGVGGKRDDLDDQVPF
jgi:single-strand DNA-binding protein